MLNFTRLSPMYKLVVLIHKFRNEPHQVTVEISVNPIGAPKKYHSGQIIAGVTNGFALI